MRFLDREGREPSGCILDVGVREALRQVFWDRESFGKRGGVYDWTREPASEGCGAGGAGGEAGDLQW